MPNQMNINKLKQAEAAISIAKDALTQTLEQSSANQILGAESLKVASIELDQAQSLVNQVQTELHPQSTEEATVFRRLDI